MWPAPWPRRRWSSTAEALLLAAMSARTARAWCACSCAGQWAWQWAHGSSHAVDCRDFIPSPPLHHGDGHAEWTALFICAIVRGETARHSAFQGSIPLPALRILQAFIGSISMKQPVMQRPVAVHRRWLVQRRGPPPSRAAALLSHWREPVPCLLHPVPSRRF